MSDHHYRWVVVGYTLVIQAFTLGILVYSFALFAVPWINLFDAPRRDVMLAASLLQFGVGIASPVVGRAMDRVPMRHIILAGLAALILGLSLASQARALWQLLVLYATLLPLAVALMGTLASQTLITRWFDANRGLAIGVSATGTNLGGILFPLLVGYALPTIGWRETLVGLAAASFVVVAPLTWLLLRREPEAVGADGSSVAGTGRAWTTAEILSSSLFWLPVLCILPLNIAFGAVQFNLGAYASDLGYPAEVAARLVALSSVCMILGKFFFGGLGDRLDHRWLYWIAIGCMASAMLILQAEPSIAVLTLGVVGVGLAGGGILPLMGLIFGARFGVASFGRVMGLVMLSFTLGALGPLLAGWTFDATGSYDAIFLVFLGVFVPAAVAMRWLPAP